MRRRSWIAFALLVLGLAIGIAGRSLPGTKAWNLAAGLLVLAAAGLWVSLLPVWSRLSPEPMPGLFPKPGMRERWCPRCGNLTPRQGPCRTCGHAPRATRVSRGK